MSKRGYISRYLLILKKLKSKPYSSFSDLQNYFESQVEYLQVQDESLQIGFSKRTLQRDLREIRNTFGIDIEFSKSAKGYFIAHSESENLNFQRMIEAFDMFNSLKFANDLTKFIQLEKRRPQGTENLHGFLHAIKKGLKVKFSYYKFENGEVTQRLIDPYALKEFKNRWYIYSRDCEDNIFKTFALDRITNLEITLVEFVPAQIDIENTYYYSFGIISPNEKKPQEVILSFTPFQGRYIKSLPIHHTQQILVDNEFELRIKLDLFITYDFVMEILSYGKNIKIIEPKSLVNEILDHYRATLNQYL